MRQLMSTSELDPAATAVLGNGTLLNTTIVGAPWRKDYQLGIGVDAITGQLRSSAVKPFTVEDQKPLNPRYLYSLVQSESDLSSLISGSVKGSYNIEGVDVSASTSFLDSVTVSELSVTLLAEVSVERSQFSLAPKYELSVTPGADFRDKYGDYFVAGYRNASSMYVVYQCRFSSVEKRTEFTASLSAKVPEVMTVEGSTEFKKTAKDAQASISIKISALGVGAAIPNPPGSGWTPEAVVTTLLPWFEQNRAAEPFEVYLRHYRMVDPSISGEVAIAPDTFFRLGLLYDRFWLARALHGTCPDFGRRLVDEPFARLSRELEARQASLAAEPAKIDQLTSQTQELLTTLRQINDREVFANQLAAAARTEPANGQNFDADQGRVRWSYGFAQSPKPSNVITTITDSIQEPWRIGWREHTFTFHDTSKLIVGWDIICNWADGTGGDWHKASDEIIGHSSGAVYVKSDYDRGYSWTISWHVVDASLYPSRP